MGADCGADCRAECRAEYEEKRETKAKEAKGRETKGKERHAGGTPVVLDFDALLELLVVGQNVLLAHADLEAALEATALAEAPIRRVHAALLLVRALEVLL